MTDLDVGDLKKQLSRHLQAVPDIGRTDVPKLSVAEARRGLKLSPRGRRLLGAESVEGEDRSARLFELAALLHEAGASEQAAFVLCRASVWNKFEGRDDEVALIWDAVLKTQDGGGELRRHLVSGEPELVGDFVDRSIPPPKWLVEGVLQQGGLHYVAAPKKSYKSTFVTDLALSLVSGTDFLGAMPVEQRASVLMIQEENPEGLQQLRMRAMLKAKDVSLHPETPKMNGQGVICDFSSVPFWQVNRSGLKLVYEEDRRTIENWIKRKHAEVLILDPLYLLAGCELSYGRDVLEILDWLVNLKGKLGITVVVVHHMKKLPEEIPTDLSQLMFGSSYFANSYDGAVLLMPKYVPETMMIEEVTAYRDYRAWRESAFKFSIYMEEDGSDYIVQMNQGRGNEHPLVYLVRKKPGITVAEAADALKMSQSGVKQVADRHGVIKKRKKSEGGGRPKTGLWSPQ